MEKIVTLFIVGLASTSVMSGVIDNHSLNRSLSTSQVVNEIETIVVPVINVLPVTQRIGIPSRQRVCSVEQVPVHATVNSVKPRDILGGAIIGSILGNNIKGEQHGGTAGAVVGALVANAAGNKTEVVHFHDVERCQTQTSYSYEDRVSGYDVTYEVNGTQRTARMSHHPGNYLKIQRTTTYALP